MSGQPSLAASTRSSLQLIHQYPSQLACYRLELAIQHWYSASVKVSCRFKCYHMWYLLNHQVGSKYYSLLVYFFSNGLSQHSQPGHHPRLPLTCAPPPLPPPISPCPPDGIEYRRKLPAFPITPIWYVIQRSSTSEVGVVTRTSSLPPSLPRLSELRTKTVRPRDLLSGSGR